MKKFSATVLITRPKKESAALATELERRGYKVFIEPIFNIVCLKARIPELYNTSALLFTSANGVRAFAQSSKQRNLKVFTVGDATAKAASTVGFLDVVSANGTVEDLFSLVKERWTPTTGSLLHAAGRTVSGELVGKLKESGYNVERIALYDARVIEALSAGVCEALQTGKLDYLLIFSPRTAKSFVNLMNKASLLEASRKMEAICLSSAVARKLVSLPLRQVTVAVRPDQESVLFALERRLLQASQ